MLNIKSLMDDFLFEHEVEFPEIRDVNDPNDIKWFLSFHKDLSESTEYIDIEEALKDFEKTSSALSNEELKTVYKMLKEREIHPSGTFDKQGRFYLNDRELVDVREPSAKYPFSEMNAGRTSKFVKAMDKKYRPQNLEEFLTRFSKKN